jgi:hypothetical protein
MHNLERGNYIPLITSTEHKCWVAAHQGTKKGLYTMIMMALPLPKKPESVGDDQQQKDILDQLQSFAKNVVTENASGLLHSSWYVRISFWVLLIMYVVLFLVGVVTAVFTIISGFQANTGGEAIGTLAIGGLSAASFFSLFLSRPLESLERNTIYVTWLTAIQNTYWTRLMYFSDLEKIDDDLEDATQDLVKDLTTLADKHAAAIGKYPALVGAESSKTPEDKESNKKS